MVDGVRVTVGVGARRFDLAAPADPGARYVINEVFNAQCYRRVPGLPDPRIVLDIGAHIGSAAAYFSMIYPSAEIHCVEADPRNFAFLADNAARLDRCRTYQAFLGDRAGTIRFNSSSNSALSGAFTNPLAASDTVEIATHDAGAFVREKLGAGIDLLKIDTEGSELPILRSLGDIAARAAVVYLEFHSHDDRRAIDDLMCRTHVLWRGTVESPHRGQVTYVLGSLAAALKADAPLGTMK